MASAFLHMNGTSEARSYRVCLLKESKHFPLALGIVSRNNKNYYYSHGCIDIYTFSLSLQLATALLRKLATFYMWNFKKNITNVPKHTALL